MQAPTPRAALAVDITPVLERAREFLPAERLDLVRQAFEFAADCHEGQLRQTGDPYITHPVEVTLLVAGLGMDQYALAAALLHDVQEDCGVPNAVIKERFGDEIARLVDGLTKLEQLPLRVPGEDGAGELRAGLQAQNIRKMLLAMAEDIRVVLIKLCDRLHNMRTLYAVPADKQRRIARETLDIYAPLANRLGVWNIKWELEDLAFRYLDPRRYKEIADRLDAKRQAREKYVNDVKRLLEKKLAEAGIPAMVEGRAKHIYSIYQKLQRYSAESKSFDQIYDLLALRVRVDTVADCYHALGVVHALWRPLPGQFDDYIANPKDSMYQSLHTTVVAPGGRPLEVQIRTHEMHRVAEYGVAAHWRYKEGFDPKREDEERISWLRQLLEWQRDLAGAEEFVESVKTDIFKDQVFVFTPKGDVIDLPAGATALDFAFRIHTDLGYQTVGAKVNGKMTSLNTALKNGDVVEIMRSRASRGPSRDWLNDSLGYLRTSHARQKVRQWFRKRERVESLERGREMLEREMRRLAVDLTEYQDRLVQLFKVNSFEDLLVAVGYGDISTEAVTRKISRIIQEEESPDLDLPEIPSRQAPATQGGPGLRVLGVNNVLTTMARCCNPVPGDQIIGYITRGRGVTVHRADCHNILNEDEPQRLVDVEWGSGSRQYPASIRIFAWDRVGLLRDVATLIANESVNMVGVRTVENGDGTVNVLATLETTGIEQISRLLARIETIRGVIHAERSVGRRSKTPADTTQMASSPAAGGRARPH